MSEKTKEIINEIKADQFALEETFKQLISEFEAEHNVVVPSIRIERISVAQMGTEVESILSRVLIMVAITPELADDRR